MTRLDRVRVGRVALAMLVVVAWAAHAAFWPEGYVPHPSQVLARLAQQLANGDAITAVAPTVARAASGFAIGCGSGLLVGLALCCSPHALRVMDPLLGVGAGIPKYALIPWLVLWLGIDNAPKIVLIALLVFFPTTIAVSSALRAVPLGLLRMAQVVGAGRVTIAREVLWRSVFPYVAASVRVTIPRALSGTIVLEMLIGDDGLGRDLRRAGETLDTVGLFAATIQMVAVVVACDLLARRGGRGRGAAGARKTTMRFPSSASPGRFAAVAATKRF